MSTVETIRDIPVIVQHMKVCSEPMDFDDDYYGSGFPFDNTGRRSRDPLEDIAQRHPEFAQHLQGFPRRSQRSAPEQTNDEFLRRRFERPFASGRFERFGFPFDRDDFEREPQRYYEAYPEYFENFQNQQPQNQNSSPQGYQQHPPQYSQQYQPQENQPEYKNQRRVSQGTQTEEDNLAEQHQEEQKAESGQTTRGRPIQQSNTCDLTQHQPPDESLNDREQRSMSAPPENKRFTSSVNIPMGVHSPDGAASQTNSGSTERVIPIHVEGRDDPVIPKQASAQTQADSPRSQPETIFGRRPEAFSQFVHREPHRFNNDWQHSFGGFPEEDFGFSRSESPSRFAAGAKPQQPPRQESHQQQQAPRQEAKPQQEQSEPPKQQQQPLGPIEQIQAIQKDVSTLLRQVEAFNGLPRDKNYLYLDEMLTRNLLKLDNVDTQGQDTIRSARKEAIKCIERAISLLEARAAANAAPKQENMEVDEQKPQESEEKNEAVAEVSQEASGESATEQPKSDETMENAEAEAKKEEINSEEPKPVEETPKEETEVQVEDENKEKRKIKKKQ
ncbi:unnamed protein product [Ceutorhynchus assimilis]|uniref:BAG domain-containing protein n=1 Tax=Ceutorhynchus assimilis TaxID=467358 RepID=A0A9N9MP57_9CUCU|nr:unnamed protein product [Ceutorhynchus assimilis]